MALRQSSESSPRDVLKCIRPHKGLMCFRPEENDYVKYAVVLGAPNNAGFIPIEKNVGVIRLGVIYLKNQGSVRSGYYAVTPRDLHRRRVDARVSKRLTDEQAILLIGGSVEHLGVPDATTASVNAAIEPRALSTAESAELVHADVCFQEQIQALHASEDSEEGWL